MRVNVYAEEMTDQFEIVEKESEDGTFTGFRIYLHLPVTIKNGDGREETSIKGPFLHKLGDDDSSAITFWGKHDLRESLKKALVMLDEYYESQKAYRAPTKLEEGDDK